MNAIDKKLSKNIIYKFILNVFNIVVPLLVGPYVMRILTPNQIGELNFSQSIISYFFVFASFGVYQYGLREISKVREDKIKVEKTFTSLITITLISNLICTVLYLIVVFKFYRSSDIYIILMFLTINFFSNAFYVEWINEATENYDFITKKSVFIRIIYIVAIFIIVKSSKNFYDYIFIIIITGTLNNITSYIYVKKKFSFDFKELKIARHIRPMFYVVILTNAGMLYTQMDKLLLGEFTNNVEVAYYSTSQNIMRVINVLLLTLIEATIPRLSTYAVNNKKKYNELLNQIIKSYFVFLFPTALGLCFISKEVMTIYAGKEYINASSTLVIFAIYMIVIGYENIISNQIMYIQGKEKIQIIMNFLGGIFNVIAMLILGKIGVLDSEKAIGITLVCNSIVVLMQYIYVKRKLKQVEVKFLDKNILIYIFTAILFYPITKIIKYYVSNEFMIVILSIVICGAIYLGSLILNKDSILISIINGLKKKEHE